MRIIYLKRLRKLFWDPFLPTQIFEVTDYRIDQRNHRPNVCLTQTSWCSPLPRLGFCHWVPITGSERGKFDVLVKIFMNRMLWKCEASLTSSVWLKT